MKTKVISLLIVLFWVGMWGCASTQSREALNLYNKGANEYKNERYNDALEYFEKSLNINKSIGNDEGIAPTLHYIGMINKKFGNYDKSLTFFEDALNINKKLNLTRNIASTLHEIGSIYRSQGKHDEAIKKHEEVLKIHRQLNLEQDMAEDLGIIGLNYNSIGQNEKALFYLEESLKIRRELNIPKDIALSLDSIGIVYWTLNRYEKALPYFEEAVEIYKKLNIPEDLAEDMKNIGNAYSSLGQHEKALSYYEEALKLYKKLNLQQNIAEVFDSIGSVYNNLGQYKKALTYHKEALHIFRNLNIRERIALSSIYIGKIYNLLGQYENALIYHNEALKINRELNIPRDIAMSLDNIGDVYISQGKYDKGFINFEEALNILKKLDNPYLEKFLDSSLISFTLSRIGSIYTEIDQYEKALSYYEESLKIDRKLSIPKSIATSLGNIGKVYTSLGQYDMALYYTEEALKIFREINQPNNISTALNNIGLIYNYLNQYEKALSYLEGALKVNKELNISNAITLTNIGIVYLSQKRYKEAENKFIEVEKEEKKTDIKWDNPGLVEVYIATGRNDKALKMLKDMAPKWNSVDSYRIQFHTQHGLALKGNKSFKEASSEFLKAVSISEEMRQKIKGEKGGFLGGGSAGGRIRAYRGLFSALAERAINPPSPPFAKGGIERKFPFNKGGNLESPPLEKGDIGGFSIDKEFIPYGKDLSSAAFYFAESTKARTLLEAMAESARKSQKVELPEDLREKEQSILNQLSAIENQWDDAYKRGEDVLKRLKERKDGLNVELSNLITELRQKYPRYAALNYPKPIPPEELPLKDNEVLLEYAIGDDAGYLFVVDGSAGSPRRVKRLIKIPLSREELEEKVKAFIEPMNTKKIERFSVKEAKGLYEILLAEAMKEVAPSESPLTSILSPEGRGREGRKGGEVTSSQGKGNFSDKKIIIVPDGILGLLPFESLIVKEGKDYKDSLYVGDRYQISYYQSATVLALQRNLKERKTEKPLFALGNPIYTKEDPRYLAWKESVQQAHDEKPLKVANLDKYSFRDLAIEAKWGKTTEADTTGKMIEFRPLPETEIEVKEIAKTMGVLPEPPDVLLSVAANETELKKTGFEGYKYIHFATHASLPGMIQGINEPFILLGQVENKDKDDGFLTLSEVLDLRLNADMVVLSACVTGVGKEVEGEGVANFARAFQHAGAKSIVVSLWAVASDPAVEYMEKFYGYLKAGKDRGEAMRLARNGIKAKYPNPFYWAVFILHGEG